MLFSGTSWALQTTYDGVRPSPAPSRDTSGNLPKQNPKKTAKQDGDDLPKNADRRLDAPEPTCGQDFAVLQSRLRLQERARIEEELAK